jgi:DNA recombination protein Rad52
MFTPEQIKSLEAKLDPSHVASRQQSGRALSYIEGWWAIAEANRIFGFDAWTRETVEIRCVAEKARKIGSQARDGFSVSYTAKVRVTVDGVVREGIGAGHGIDVDLGLAHESAIKEAETDAMKRALMTFGNPFGLALYDKTQANVGVDPPPEDPRSGGRKSSAQAKRDGDHERVNEDIGKADLAGVQDWYENFDSYTAHLPISWLDPIRDKLEHRREELMRPAASLAAEAEMDESFRATVPPGVIRGSDLPGSPRHMAAE